MNLPWCKFYPRDWLADTGLRSCSYAARGLWIDMLMLMAMNDQRRGYLESNGRAITDVGQIARLTGGDSSEVTKLLGELQVAGVFSRDESGVILSRRMVRDEAVSDQKSKAGLQGGNPALLKHPVKHPVKQVVGSMLIPRSQNPESRSQIPDTRYQNPIQSKDGLDSELAPGVGRILDGLVKSTSAFKQPNLDEVKQHLASLFHGADSFAEPFFAAMEKQAWKDKSGSLIQNWKALASSYVNKSETNRRTRQQNTDRNYGQIKPTQHTADVARAKGKIR